MISTGRPTPRGKVEFRERGINVSLIASRYGLLGSQVPSQRRLMNPDAQMQWLLAKIDATEVSARPFSGRRPARLPRARARFSEWPWRRQLVRPRSPSVLPTAALAAGTAADAKCRVVADTGAFGADLPTYG